MKQFVLHVISGQRRGAAAALAKPVLFVLSIVYRALHKLNRFLYALHLRPSTRLPVPVVSVGNITTGGTGKTPFVEHLARWFSGRGLRVAILSRGYGKIPGAAHDDEVIAGGSPDVARFTGSNRAKLARRVMQTFKPDIVLLDDGFQHYRLRRDLDIVLVDGVNPFSNGRVLPRGLLREKPSALKRADLIVVTRSDQIDPTRLETIRSMLNRLSGGKPIVEAAHKAVELEAPSEHRRLPLEWLRTREMVAFSGIGNPDAFKLTLESLGATIVSHVTFADHHVYLPDEVRNLNLRAKEFMAEGLVTTSKDALRLPLDGFEVPLFILKIEMKILRGAQSLEECLAAVPHTPRETPERSVTSTER